MVEYPLVLPKKQNVVWLPKPVVQALGRRLRIYPNDIAAAMYPETADPLDIANSLDHIAGELRSRAARLSVNVKPKAGKSS